MSSWTSSGTFYIALLLNIITIPCGNVHILTTLKTSHLYQHINLCLCYTFSRNLLPANVIRASIQSSYTEREEIVIPKHYDDPNNATGLGNETVILLLNNTMRKVATEVLYRDGMNVMGMCITVLPLVASMNK